MSQFNVYEICKWLHYVLIKFLQSAQLIIAQQVYK